MGKSRRRPLFNAFVATTAGAGVACMGMPATPQDRLEAISSARCSANASDSKWAALCGWAADCGMEQADAVYLGRFARESGIAIRGLGASRTLSDRELFACMPRQCMIGSDIPEVVELWQGDPRAEECDEFKRLAFYMAGEMRKGNGSRWAPVIDMFPSVEDLRSFHPAYKPASIHIPEDRDHWLHFTEGLQECYAAYSEKVGAEAAPFDEVFHAFVIASYSASIDSFVVQDPVTNLCNGGAPGHSNVAWVQDGDEGHWCLMATREIAAGEELLYDYGEEHMTLFNFFQVFGFTYGEKHTNAEPEPDGDNCRGLRPHEFPEPGPDADPVARTFWRYAADHCHGGAVDGRSGSTSAASSASLPTRRGKRHGGAQELRDSLTEQAIASGRFAANASDGKWAALCTWAAECGTERGDALYLGRFEREGGGIIRGLGASRALAKNELFACTPRRCMMASDLPEVVEFWEGDPRAETCDDYERLALYVAKEMRKGNASRWASVLAMYPSLEELRSYHPAYRPASIRIPKDRDHWLSATVALQECYDAYSAKAGSDAIPFDALFHAFVIVSYSSTIESVVVQDPVTDWCNGGAAGLYNVDWVLNDGLWCLQATRDLAAGDEILCNYEEGKVTLFSFFQFYGFTYGRDHTSARPEPDGENCAGLRPHEFPEPGPDADPVAHTFWRYATDHCHRGAVERRRRPASAASSRGKRGGGAQEPAELVAEQATAPVRCGANSSNTKWVALCAWAADCGMERGDAVFVGHFEREGGGVIRGLGASRTLLKRELFACMPRRCMMGSDLPEVVEFWEGDPQEEACDEYERLALYLAGEMRKGSDSRWAPFLDMLPSVEEFRSYHPAYRPASIRIPEDRDYWRQANATLQKCYAAYSARVGSEAIAFDEVFYANIIASYSESIGSVAVQDPVTNLCNGGANGLSNVVWVQEKRTGHWCLQAKRDLAAGEQILCSYSESRKTLSNFFAIFGFTYGQNHTSRKEDPDGDDCPGLRPHEFPEPGPDADPVAHNFWRYATEHCHPGAADRRREQSPSSAARPAHGGKLHSGAQEL